MGIIKRDYFFDMLDSIDELILYLLSIFNNSRDSVYESSLVREEMNMIEVGMMAPDFVLPNAEGEEVRLSDYRGKKVVLYFYPKDNTPGCTRQACAFAGAY